MTLVSKEVNFGNPGKIIYLDRGKLSGFQNQSYAYQFCFISRMLIFTFEYTCPLCA